MNITQIKETCLYVADLNRTKEFYLSLPGIKLISLADGKHVFFRAGKSVLLCFDSAGNHNKSHLPQHLANGAIHLAFEVDKEEYELAKKVIQSLGIVIEHEENWHSGLKSFYFRDPDGNLLEIVPSGLWGG